MCDLPSAQITNRQSFRKIRANNPTRPTILRDHLLPLENVSLYDMELYLLMGKETWNKDHPMDDQPKIPTWTGSNMFGVILSDTEWY